MFHQVFICDETQDPDSSRNLLLDQNNVNNAPQTIKQENLTSGDNTMGLVLAEDIKMAVGTLKSEKCSLLNNQTVMETDTEVTKMDLDAKDFLVPSLSSMVFPVSQTGQTFMLPVTTGPAIQPLQSTLISSPGQVILEQPQQAPGIQPLGPTYVFQTSVENALQPQPTLIKMSGNIIQLAAPPAPLLTGALAVSSSPVINTDFLQQSTQDIQNLPTVSQKTEPLSSLINVVGEGLKIEKTDLTSNQTTIKKKEQPMEDDLHAGLSDSGDNDVQKGVFEFKEGKGNNTFSSGLQNVGQPEKETTGSVPYITDSVLNAQYTQSYPKSQKHCANKHTSIKDSELRLIHNIKECTVLLNKTISGYITPELIQDANFKIKTKTIVTEASISSDKDEGLSDRELSSGSDWEEEYFGELLKSKTQEKLTVGINNKTMNDVQDTSLVNPLIQKNCEPYTKISDSSSEKRNYNSKRQSAEEASNEIKMSNTASSRSLMEMFSPVTIARRSTLPLNNENVIYSITNVPSQNNSTKTLKNKFTTNPRQIKLFPKKETFKVQHSAKTTIKNIQKTKTVPFNKDHQYPKNGKIIFKDLSLSTKMESKFKNITTSNVTQNTINNLKRIIQRTSLRKPNAVSTGPHTSGIGDVESCSDKGLITSEQKVSTSSVDKRFLKKFLSSPNSFITITRSDSSGISSAISVLKNRNSPDSRMQESAQNTLNKIQLRSSLKKFCNLPSSSDTITTSETLLLSSPSINENISKANIHVPLQIDTNKYFFRKVSTESIKLDSEKYNCKLNLSLKTTMKNASIHFVPQQNTEQISDSQYKSNENIKIQLVGQTKTQQNYSNGEKSIQNISLTHKEPMLKNHTSSQATQNNENYVSETKPSKILSNQRVFPADTQSSSPGGRISNKHFDDNNEDENGPVPQHTYYCKKCNKYFESLDKLNYHKSQLSCYDHSVNHAFRRIRKKIYSCSFCDKSFASRVKKEGHENSHTNARPFKCSDCDKCFNSKTARYMHHNNMHLNKKTTPTRYLCCFCGYITKSSEHLWAHEESHQLPEGSEIPKPFKCLVCGKGFISKWKVQHHKREHQLRKCPECSEKFKTRVQLRNHLGEVHKIIKTYECKECAKQFKQPGGLRSHLKFNHSSVLSFTCDICDKGFKRKNNLQQHMITHSDERPISCPECGDSFKRITHLKQHTAAFHGEGRK